MNSLGLLGRILLLVVAISGCSCQPYRSVTASERARLTAHAEGDAKLPRFERRSVRLTAKGGQWEGQFVGILMGQRRPSRLRMQLFADLGTKVVDLTADPKKVVVGTLEGGKPFVWRYAQGLNSERHRLAVFAMSLHTAWQGLEPGSVLRIKATESGFDAQVAPHPSGANVVAELDAELRLRRWRFSYFTAQWQIEPGPPIVLTAGQTRVEMRIDEREVVDDVAPEIFVLQVSEDDS